MSPSAPSNPADSATAPSGAPVPRARFIRVTLLLTLGLALLGRGTFFTSDEGGIFNTAVAIALRGTHAIGPGEGVHPGRDGRQYSRREILPMFLAVPTVWAGVLVDRLTALAPPLAAGPASQGPANWPAFVTLSVWGPLCLAATTTLLWRGLVSRGLDNRSAVMIAGVTLVSTPLVVYSKTLFSQLFETLLLLVAVEATHRWTRRPSRSAELVLMSSLALFELARPASAPAVLCFLPVLVFAGQVSLRRRVEALFLAGVGIAAGTLGVCFVNWFRWGNPLDFGYHDATLRFSTPWWQGTLGLYLSPGKSLFLYAPLLLVPLCGMASLIRRRRAEALLALALTVVYTAIASRWSGWSGDLCWGPRFVVPLIPVWVAAATPLWTTLRGRQAALALGVAGALLQLPGLLSWIHWINARPHQEWSLTDSHLPRTIAALVRHGIDDLWLFNTGSPLSTICGLVAIALFFRLAWKTALAAPRP